MYKLLALSGFLVLLDQATKLAVKGFSLFGFVHKGMDLYTTHELFGDTVRITFIENPGMAFGLNFDMPMLLSFFSLAASCFLVYLIIKTESDGITGLRLAFALILAGAVGNLIDRTFYGIFYDYAPLFHGRVVDFIDVDIPNIGEQTRFYTFNVADAAVSVGVVLLLFFYPKKENNGEIAPEQSGEYLSIDTADRSHSESAEAEQPTSQQKGIGPTESQ